MIKTPVLCFHKISDRFEWGVNSYPVKSFEKLIRLLLRNGYEFVLPEDISSVQKPLILTFDDGYASVFHNALPLLEELNLPYIVFPVLNYLGKENRWDEGAGGIYSRHLSEEELKICLSKRGEIGIHGLKHRAFSLMTEAEKEVELKRCFGIIKEKFAYESRYFAPPFGEKIDGHSLFEKIEYSFILDNDVWNGENSMVSRFTVYRYESPEWILKKINGGRLPVVLARLVRLGARATVLRQKIKSRNVHN